MTKPVTPWYKQFWPWVLICLPLSVVFASIYTVRLATTDSPSMVIDDYYKSGKAINLELTKYKVAVESNIEYQATIAANVLTLIALNKKETQEPLTVFFQHSTLQSFDFTLQVSPSKTGVYSVKMDKFKPGKWQVSIAPQSERWRVKYAGYIDAMATFNINAKALVDG